MCIHVHMYVFMRIRKHKYFLCIPDQIRRWMTQPASAGWKQQSKCRPLEMIICSHSRGHGGKGKKKGFATAGRYAPKFRGCKWRGVSLAFEEFA